MIVAHLYEAPGQLGPELPSDLEDVILKCLSKSLQDCLGSVNNLDKALWPNSNVRRLGQRPGRAVVAADRVRRAARAGVSEVTLAEKFF